MQVFLVFLADFLATVLECLLVRAGRFALVRSDRCCRALPAARRAQRAGCVDVGPGIDVGRLAEAFGSHRFAPSSRWRRRGADASGLAHFDGAEGAPARNYSRNSLVHNR